MGATARGLGSGLGATVRGLGSGLGATAKGISHVLTRPTTIGLILGAGAGALAGKGKSKQAKISAMAIGAVVGGLGGALVGSNIKAKKQVTTLENKLAITEKKLTVAEKIAGLSGGKKPSPFIGGAPGEIKKDNKKSKEKVLIATTYDVVDWIREHGK